MNAPDPIVVRNYIDGAWRAGSTGATFESRDPYSGDLVATAQVSSLEDVGAAVGAARRAFDDSDWRLRPGKARAAVLLELADRLEARTPELSQLVAREMGKPIRYARERELEPAIDRIRFYAGAARLVEGVVTSAAASHLLNLVLREPVGVCAFITPWNDPIDLPLRKIGAALASGCTFVLKPASDAPASSMAIFDLLDGLPGLRPASRTP
jgi:acyl-CoA reductase-like NAD-dependent aldehyde dehydrogenase